MRIFHRNMVGGKTPDVRACRFMNALFGIGYSRFTKEKNTMNKPASPIYIAGSKLGVPRHVCAFFNSEDEKYRVLLPFIKDGFECGDKAVHVINPDQHADHLQRLAEVGID